MSSHKTSESGSFQTQEEWKPIKGYEDLYEISNLGRVKRVGGGQGAIAGRILTGKKKRTAMFNHNQSNMYRQVDLSRNDKKTRRLIHQLVAEVFLPPRPSSAHFPNHKDTDKANNAASNLEWATRIENIAHARAHGLIPPCRGEKNGRARLTERAVLEIRRLKGTIGQRKIAQMFRVSRTTIQWIHQGKHWT